MAPLGELTSLRSLTLHTPGVTGSGLGHLRGLTKLRELSLYGLRLHDDDLLQLEVLSGLRSLNLSVHGVTSEGVGRLQRARPQLLVGYSYTGRLVGDTMTPDYDGIILGTGHNAWCCRPTFRGPACGS